MIAYRITLSKHAGKLVASGKPNRWNSRDLPVLYTAESISLACLENVVHRSSEGLSHLFKVAHIYFPDEQNLMQEINLKDLPTGWNTPDDYSLTQPIGDEWQRKNKKLILKVPSAIVPADYNYLLNPKHPKFSAVKVLKIEDFYFDPRLKK